MNSRTLKIGGAAALGIAFAAAAAGTASAAPADQAMQQLPLRNATSAVPGVPQSVDVATRTIGFTTGMIPATAARTLPAATSGVPGRDLLGGKGNVLPTSTLTRVVPLLGGLGA